MESFFSGYFYSLAEFWSSAFRIGLPQILLIVLVVWWLKRKRCGQGGDACDTVWSFGTRCGCCCCQGPCCNDCCCRRGTCDQTAAEAEEAVSDAD